MTRDSRIRFLVDQAYESTGQAVRPAYEVSHMTTAIMMVEAGLGVAVLPAYVRGFARAFNVVPKILSEPEVRREVGIIHADRPGAVAGRRGVPALSAESMPAPRCRAGLRQSGR